MHGDILSSRKKLSRVLNHKKIQRRLQVAGPAATPRRLLVTVAVRCACCVLWFERAFDAFDECSCLFACSVFGSISVTGCNFFLGGAGETCLLMSYFNTV